MRCLNNKQSIIRLVRIAFLILASSGLTLGVAAQREGYYGGRPPVTEELLEQSRVWKNWLGRPYFVAVYEQDFSVSSVHLYQLRSDLAWDLMTDEIYQAFQDFADRQEVSERFDCVAPNEKWVGYFGDYSEADNQKCRRATWFRMNVSEISGRSYMTTTIAECFAWYTGPDYERGMLPEELEVHLEDMVQGRMSGKPLMYVEEEYDLWRNGIVPETVGILYRLRHDNQYREERIPREPKSAGWVTSFAHRLNAIKDSKKAGVWPE